MRTVIAIVRFLSCCIAGIVLGTLLGFFITVILQPFLIPGDNPHIDAYDKLGLAMVGSAGGAALGLIAAIVWTVRHARKTTSNRSENLE